MALLDRHRGLVFGLVSAAYVGLRLWAFWPQFNVEPRVFPDSYVYAEISRLPFFSSAFWTSWDPIGFPLFLKLLPGSNLDVPVAQLTISIVCWLVLAVVVAGFLERPLLKLAGLVTILGFSLSSEISQWDGNLLTESLTFSEAALLVAALLLVLRRPTRWNAFFVIAAAAAFALTRDASGYLAVLLVLPVAVALARRAQAVALVLAVAVLALGGIVYTTSQSVRWEIFLRDTVALRVLPDPDTEAYYVTRGMPIQPDLQNLLYHTTPDPPSPFDNEPRLAAMHTWFLEHGEETFHSYLLSHPSASLGDPLRNFDKLIGPSSDASVFVVGPQATVPNLNFYNTTGYRPALRPLQRIFYPGSGWAALTWMLLALGVLTVVGVFNGRGRPFWIVPAVCILATIPYAVIVWDATPEEIARHALLVGALGRLGLWLAVLFVLDVFRREDLGLKTS